MEPPASIPPHWARSTLLWIGIVLSLAGLGLYVYAFLNPVSKGQWDPLGKFTVPQQVTNGPVIHLGETVNTVGTKCYDEDVSTRSVKVWEATSGAPVDVVTEAQKVKHQSKGCVTKRFENRIPEAVALLVRSGVREWELVGTVTPFRDGEQGAPRSWETTKFRLVP